MFILRELTLTTRLPYTIGNSPFEKEGQPCEIVSAAYEKRGTAFVIEVETKAGVKELEFDDKQDAIRSGWKI